MFRKLRYTRETRDARLYRRNGKPCLSFEFSGRNGRYYGMGSARNMVIIYRNPDTDPEPPLEQLFDLDVDPLEEKDLAGDPIYVDTLLSLRARCGDYRKSLAGGDAAVARVIQ